MTTRSGRMRCAAGLLVALAVVLAGCTGVPSDSTPMVIKTVPIAGAGGRAAATTPAPDIAPNTLVADFLQANALDASQQTSPRAFLSPGARNSWSDAEVTVVDEPVVVSYDARRATVKVTARVVGKVDSSGVYAPAPQGPRQPFVYGVKLVDGQYRITSLPNGLLLSESDFLSYYTQRSVYFFDLAHRYLVPDPRWTSLTDPTQLADFLMTGLASDPSPSIENAVGNDTLPARATTGRISVTIHSTTKVEIPGSSQLDALGRDRLAEQVAATLAGVVHSDELVLTDGGKAVPVPAAHGTDFTVAEFAGRTGPPAPPPDVYFLRRGRVYGQDGQDAMRLKGAVNGAYFLQSVAVSQDKQQSTNAIAATAGNTPKQVKLLVGTQSGGLRPTTVHGPLTRPAFAPGRSEVWVGDGQTVYAVTVHNEDKTQHVARVRLPAGAGGGTIVALRLSPDGSRVALVIRSAAEQHPQELFVGAVLRTAGQISIGTLQQVTPAGVEVTDVAWEEPLKLLAIGRNTATLEQQVYDVGSDGSGFGATGTGNLPGSPSTLAVAVHQPAWVTVGSAVWEQSFNDVWVSPGPDTETEGYAAVYLE